MAAGIALQRRCPPTPIRRLPPPPRPPPQGTGATEAQDFSEAYGLDVVRVPPHRPSRRVDHPMALSYFREVRLGWGVGAGDGCGAALRLVAAGHRCSQSVAWLRRGAGAPVWEPRRQPHPALASRTLHSHFNLPSAQGRNREVEALLLASLAAAQPVLIGTGSVEESGEMHRVVLEALE